MSGELSPYLGGGLVRDARRSSRAISRYQACGQVRIAKVDIETDVALAKEDAVTTATGSAMGSVVRVAQLQRQLEQIAPEAAGRLAFLADDHMLSMGDIMQDLRRDRGEGLGSGVVEDPWECFGGVGEVQER